MAGFLYKDLSKKEREEISLESKKIINSFGKKLELVKNLPSESSIEKNSGYRLEEKESPCDLNFEKRILENAPHKTKDSFISEKKSW